MRRFFIFLMGFFFLSTPFLFSQTKSRQADQKNNFFAIRKAFYDQWKSYHVVNGYYEENGVRKKVPGWKQFKRWEWYWEYRIDPKTGAFPSMEKRLKALKRDKINQGRSSSGNWSSLGPSVSAGGYAGLGRINCIAFHPGDNNTWWVGSPSGGLWKTTDDGATWNPLTDDNPVLGVSDIAIPSDYAVSQTIYIATGDRDGGSLHSLSGGQYHDNNTVGVLKSTDGGNTWTETGLSAQIDWQQLIGRLLMDPDNNDVLYAGTSSGIYKTSDGGDHWNQIYANGYFIDMEFKPGDPSVIYAASKDYWNQPVIIKSTDGGTTWTTVASFDFSDRRVELAVSPANPAYVYAVVSKNDGGLKGVYRSTDSGATFSLVYDGTLANHNLLGWKTDGSGGTTGQGMYDLALAVSPSDINEVYLGGVNTFKSTDGGANWTAVNCWTSSSTYNKNGAPVVHADHHSLCFRSSDAKLFEGNDGGVYCTADHGASWTDKSNGIVPGQLYRIGVSATQSDEVISGLQDNGTKLYHAGVWTDRRGGDGMECAIDFTDVNVQYASTPYGAVVRTPDHWSSVIRITQDAYGNPIHGLNETGAWVTPYLLNPSNHQTLFIGLKNVWKSVDQGNNWVKISTLNRDDKIRALAVAPSNDQVIYAACLDSIWKTTNGGTTWTDITGTLTFNGNYITYITVKNDDPLTLWVSLGEYDDNGVYRSTDGGVTWENISDGLPEVPVMCVVQNIQNTNNVELYAGTDAGIYFKPGDHKWMPYNTNLPNVVVTELDIYYDNATPANSKIRAATYGRGLWESDLYTPPSVPPAVDFAASDTTPNIGQTVYLYDSCTNTPVSYQWSFNPNTVTFKEGTSATSQNPVVVFNAAGKYTVSLTASNAAGTNTTTKTDYLHVNYCDAGGGGYNYISSVVLGQIHNSGTGSSHYADYTNLSTDLTYPSIYFITVVDSNNNASDDLGVWIDFNKDGDFDDVGEKVACYTGIKTTDSYRIYWPSSEPETGITRMRVRVKYSNNDCGSPCGTTNYGEVEDYTVVVVKESIWQGDSDDWFDPNNWDSKQVPDSFINVFIPQTPSGGNYPKIISGKTARCNTITLETGSTLIVDGTLEVRK